MTSYVELERSLFSSKPIELYRWILGAPGESIIGDFDEDNFVETEFGNVEDMEAYGWVLTNPGICTSDPEDPVGGIARLGFGEGLGMTGTIASCHSTGATGPAVATLVLPWTFTPGTKLWASFDWVAEGHWFEPMAFTIRSGSSSKSTGFNPAADGTEAVGSRVTGKITVDGTGEATIEFSLNGGFPSIGHDDRYLAYNLHVYAIAPGEGEEEPDDEVIYGHTSAKNDVTFMDEVYEHLEISRSEIVTGGEDQPGALTVTLPTDSNIGEMLKEGLAYAPLRLQVIRLQRGAMDDPAYIFDGEVISAQADETTQYTTVQCAPDLARMQEVVPHELVQKDQCPWQTGDPHTCKVDLTKFTFTGVVAAISTDDLTIEVTGAADFVPDLPGATTLPDMFVGGIIRKGPYSGPINAQNLDFVALDEPLPTLEVGDTVTLVAGDDRSKETCKNKFQNIDNFGAFIQLPAVNPAYGQNLRP